MCECLNDISFDKLQNQVCCLLFGLRNYLLLPGSGYEQRTPEVLNWIPNIPIYDLGDWTEHFGIYLYRKPTNVSK
jgi:hypothetical protein